MNYSVASALILSIATFSPAVASQDGSCAPAGASVPSGLAGAWIGTNSAMQKLEEMLARMAPGNSVRTTIGAEISRSIGMQIYPDGYYVTIPLSPSVEITDIIAQSSGESITVETDMTLLINTASGWIWTEGSQLFFCTFALPQPVLNISSTSSAGGSANAVVSPFGPPGFTPEISYTLAGDSFSFTVALPAPVGDVDYYLTRVPLSRFDEEFQELYDSRFAPADEVAE
ncbi:MAG: hypothetical protein ACC631_04665 [Halocynthiibacter sp.]